MTSRTEHKDSADADDLLRRVDQGDRHAAEQLLGLQRDYLRRMLEARMEPALRQRVDPSDIIQETLMEANRRLDDYLRRRPTTFRLWVRRKALEQLINARRHHQARKRSVQRETPLHNVSSVAITRAFVSERASAALERKERAEQVQAAVEQLSAENQEILLLRNVEQLSNAEVAQLLEIEPKTASKRYGRAVLKLAELLRETDDSLRSRRR
jgi:RNA polymerase sigma-70 factor (ECF subfamily)